MSGSEAAPKSRRAVASANSYLKLYGGDYLRDTMHLSAAEDGIYLRLLFHYWHSQRPLPAEPRKLEGIARVRDDGERAALASVLDEFFSKRGKRYHNRRMDAEIESAKRYSRSQSEAGKVGGKKSAETRKTRQATVKRPSSDRQAEGKARSSDPQARHSHSHKGGVNRTPPLDPPSAVDSVAGAERLDLVGDKAEPENPTSKVETAYRNAMAKRYAVDPGPLNKKQRGQIAMMLGRVPRADSPAIVAHYVTMDGPRGLYKAGTHPVDLLLRDCESIRLAWQIRDVATPASGPPWYRTDYPQRTEEFCKRGREFGLKVPTRGAGTTSDEWGAFFAAVWVRAEPDKPWHDATNAVMSELVEQARAAMKKAA